MLLHVPKRFKEDFIDMNQNFPYSGYFGCFGCYDLCISYLVLLLSHLRRLCVRYFIITSFRILNTPTLASLKYRKFYTKSSQNLFKVLVETHDKTGG